VDTQIWNDAGDERGVPMTSRTSVAWTVKLSDEQLLTALTALECHRFEDPATQRTADLMVSSILASLVDQFVDREIAHTRQS
jgi:hypothetical protein